MKPNGLDKEIDNVIILVKDKIDNLTEDKLDELKKSIKNELLKKDTNLSERTERVWGEILDNSLEFERKAKLLTAIDGISKKDLINLFQKTFFDNPNKLSLQIYAGGEIDMKSLEIAEKYGLNERFKTMKTPNIKVLSETPFVFKKENDDEEK